MSWQASAWAASLPYKACGAMAFRVLIKLADAANPDGTATWRTAQELADELGVSIPSIRRATSELRDLGLILIGDQRYVQHIRRDRRPVVYDLPIGRVIQPPLANNSDETTENITPEPSRGNEPDTPSRGSKADTPSTSRGISSGRHGVSPVDTPNRTILKRSISSTSATNVRARPIKLARGDIVTIGKASEPHVVESLYTGPTRRDGPVQFASLRPLTGGPPVTARTAWCHVQAPADSLAAGRLTTTARGDP